MFRNYPLTALVMKEQQWHSAVNVDKVVTGIGEEGVEESFAIPAGVAEADAEAGK